MSNGRVDASAVIYSTIAGTVMMRNTLPPLASNDLLCARWGDRVGHLRDVCVLQPDGIYKIKDLLSERCTYDIVPSQGATNQRVRRHWRFVHVNHRETKRVW